MRYGASCLLAGAALRCFSTLPPYQHQLAPHTRFWLTFTGQAIIALGHPFLITMSTKVSQVWFPERERLVSTAALAGAPALGAMIGSVVAPQLVREDPNNIPILNIAFPCLALAGFLLTWLVVRLPHPPSPPSNSARALLARPPPSLAQFLSTARTVFHSNTIK